MENRREWLKKVPISLVAGLAIGSVAHLIRSSQAQENPATEREESYIIFIDSEDGNKIKARNGITGKIDYSDADAATVIQNAIDGLTNGGKIFVKQGIYSITQPIAITKNNFYFEGEGRSTTLQGAAGSVDVLTLTSPRGSSELENIGIENLTVCGYSRTDSGNLITSTQSAGTSNRVARLCLRGLKLVNVASGKSAIYLVNPVNVYIEDSMITGLDSNSCGITAIADGYASGHICLVGNYFHFGGSYNGATMLHFSTASGSSLRRVTAVANSFWMGSGATLGTAVLIDGCSSQGYRFISNSFEEFYKTFNIQPSSGYLIRDVRIENNMIWYRTSLAESGQSMIYTGTRTKGIQIVGNYFEAVPGSGATGINDDNGAEPNNKIERNEFRFVDSPIQPTSVFTKMRGNIGYVTENAGTATFSGNGAATFTIAHGLASTPRIALVTAGSSDARGDFYVTYDASNITVTYGTPPPTGTNNVVLLWYAEM